jgi:two-component system cell cycle sensor histidine kinase/response regulator CckA
MRAKTDGAGQIRPIRILVMIAQDQDYQVLHDLLLNPAGVRMLVERECSAQEPAACPDTANYDLVLCDLTYDEFDQSQFARITPAAHRPPVVFMQEHLAREPFETTIQRSACHHTGDRRLAGPCPALAILGAIESYCAYKRKLCSQTALDKLRKVVEQSPDLVIITDNGGAIEYVNPAFENITGYTQPEIIGQTLGILKSDQQPGEIYEEMWDTVLSGNVFRGVVVNRKKNGESFIVEKAITPLMNERGLITHFISTARDITERRKLEAQLEQAQRMDAIGRLAGGVAHDFNNLLMVISANAELTLDALAAEHPLRHNVGEILTASRRAADLTRQLLAFGRKQMQSLQVVDMNTVVGETCKMLPRLVGEDIQLIFVPASDLGRVKADPMQLDQVLMNLAANARDAMPQGGKLTIETANAVVDEAYVQRRSVVPLGDYVVLSVTDSGQGIAHEHLAHIFEPFYTTKSAGKGTGLGLATVYGIVKQSGGYIWVYSEPRLGTTFKIYLPRVNAAKVESAAAAAVEKSPNGCETLLLVEDEAAVRESEREFLVRHGYVVLEAHDGEDALAVSRKYSGPIHIMVSDVVMPKLGGPMLAQKLAEERPHMAVLYVSGYAENTVLAHGHVDVQNNFLQKPFSLRALGRKVRSVLDAKAALSSAAGAN